MTGRAEGQGARPTPSQTIGPFFRFATEWLSPPSGGQLEIVGTVYDGAHEPVPDALLEFWQLDRFTRCLTDNAGRFSFRTDKPVPVGGGQAPHIDVSLFARGLLQRVLTRIYFPDEVAANEGDPVIAGIEPARRTTLIAAGEGDSLRFDIHLQGDRETVFFAW